MPIEVPPEMKPAGKVTAERKPRNPDGKCCTPGCRRKATDGDFYGRPAWCAEHHARLAEIATALEGEGKKMSGTPGRAPAEVKVRKVKPSPRRKLSDAELCDAAHALVSAADGEVVSRGELALRLGVNVPKLERALADDARLVFGSRGVSLPDDLAAA